MAYLAGQFLLAEDLDDLANMLPRTFTKPADQTYSSTVTAQNDVDLTCSLEANSTYEVVMNLVMMGTAGDIITLWSAPINAAGFKICQGPALTSTDRSDTTMATAAHGLATQRGYGLNSATNFAGARETGLVVTIDAGTLTLQHMQNSSNAAPSGLVANTWMTVRKIA